MAEHRALFAFCSEIPRTTRRTQINEVGRIQKQNISPSPGAQKEQAGVSKRVLALRCRGESAPYTRVRLGRFFGACSACPVSSSAAIAAATVTTAAVASAIATSAATVAAAAAAAAASTTIGPVA